MIRRALAAVALPAVAWALLTPALVARAAGPSRPAPDRFDTRIDRSQIARAIALARSGDRAALDRFHAPYVSVLNDPLIERVEVVTEYRRVVLAAEERVRAADAAWGVPEAVALLAPFRGTVSIVVQVRFSPQNILYRMPAFALVLYDRPPSAAPIAARDVRQVARYVAGQLAPPGSPLLGGSIEATFDATRLDPRGAYLAGISEEGHELRRVPIDFRRIE